MELRHPRPPALSTAAAAPRVDPPGGAGRRVRDVVGALARVALLAGPTVLGFASGGYFEGARLKAAIAAWVLVAVLAVVADGPVLPRSAAVRLAVGGLAGLALWALISRSWAPLAGPAGEDVQRDVLYLGALVAGVLAWRGRRAGRRWARSVEALLTLGILVVIGYGLVGRLAPGLLELKPSFYAGGRLDKPLTYWNAMGVLAAIGIVLCARLAGDRVRHDALRVAAAGAGLPLALGLYLTYSRGALGAVGCGLLVLVVLAWTWDQLRAAALVVAGGVAVSIVAGRLDGVASLKGSLGHRESQGAIMAAVLVAAMLAVAALQAYSVRAERAGGVWTGPLSHDRRLRALRLTGWAAAIALALFPYAAAVVSERGNENPAFGATAQRFSSVGSNRYAYWRVAYHTFTDHPLKGTGAASFRVSWLQQRPFPESVHDAHSLYFETLAELGLIGFVLLCALLAGVVLAVRRTLGEDPALAIGPTAALVVWAVHAGVDWDWEMPAVTLVAVTLAGMLLARVESAGGLARPPRPAPPPRG